MSLSHHGRPVVPKADVIGRCRHIKTARLVLASIDRRVCDAQAIGWKALEQSWRRDAAAERLAMKRRGWT